MGIPVPTDDMPSNIVPSDDLPAAPVIAALAKPKNHTDNLAADQTKGAIGTAEAAGQLGTGMIAAPIAGLAGLFTGATNTLTDALGMQRSMPDAADVVNRTKDALTYKPQTAAGQTVSSVLGTPGRLLGKAGAGAGSYTLDKTGSPALAALVDSTIQAAPLAAGPVLGGAGDAAAALEAAAAKGTGAAAEAAPAIAKAATPPVAAPAPSPAPGMPFTPGSVPPIEGSPAGLTHTIGDTGDHNITLPNGSYLNAQETDVPRGPAIQADYAFVPPAARGSGQGTAMYEQLVQHALGQGKTLASDTTVSPSVQRVYDALENKGYTVVKNPANESEATGNLVSQDGRPVFEVTAAPKPDDGTAPAVDPTDGLPTTAKGDMTPDQIRQAHVQTLLDNNISLRQSQRNPTTVAGNVAGSAGRAGDTLLGTDPATPAQAQQFTQAVLKTVGSDAKNATPDTMSALKDQISAKYNGLLGRTPTTVDDQLVSDVGAQRQQILTELGQNEAAPLLNQIDNITAKSNAGLQQTAQAAADQLPTTGANLKAAQQVAKQRASDAAAAASTADQAAQTAATLRAASDKAAANVPEGADADTLSAVQAKAQDAAAAEAQATAAKAAAERASQRADAEALNVKRVQAIHDQTTTAAVPPTGLQPGVIDGRTAQTIRSSLNRMQGSANPSIAFHAGQLKDTLDDAFQRSATPQDAKAMTAVRQQFGRTKDIENAVAGNPNGQISPAKLMQVLAVKANRGSTVYGAGDQSLVDLARAGKAVLGDTVGNSGTAARSADVAKIAGLLTHPVATVGTLAGALGGRFINRPTATGTAADLATKATAPTMTAKIASAIGNSLDDAGTAAGTSTQHVVLPRDRQRQIFAAGLTAMSPQQQRAALLAQALRQ